MLNSGTIPGVGFFAVQLELLQIGTERAPHFQVLVRPNEWAQTARRETAERSEWNWEAYASQMRLPADRLEVGQKLVEAIEAAVQERDLPWQTRFRKGYVAIQRSGGYNVVVVDVYWRQAPRLAVKLPAEPTRLGLTNPYPDLPWDWNERDLEIGWTIPAGQIPDVGPAIEMTLPYQPTAGNMRMPSETEEGAELPIHTEASRD